jgi:putative nucleotidyltransferase with HDIG domain
MPAKRYVVHLSNEEEAYLQQLVGRQATPSRLGERARMLLAAHHGANDRTIARSLGFGARRVARLRKRFAAGGLARALDLPEAEGEGHSRRVAAISAQLAGALGLPPSEQARVRRGALLHDIGKLRVPDAILLKPGPLTESEWVRVRQHPVYAYEMLRPILQLRPVAEMPYCHHERWDGTGYPRKLKGHEIPLSARIVAVADVWDALTSNRPYRCALPPEQVRAHIRAQAGHHFDPAVVEAFLALDEDAGR